MLFRGQGRSDFGFFPLVVGIFSGREFNNFLADSHAAPIVATHRTKIGVDIQIFVMEGARRIRIEAEVKMFLPVQGGAGFGQFVIPVAGTGNPQGNVCGVCGNFVGDAALFYIVLFGESQMFFRSDVTEHRGTVIACGGGTNATRNMVIPWKNIGD